jgi:uncharacterized protein with FMN-binding domain
MKRIVYAILATISGVVLLFSYRTSLEAVTPQAQAATQETDASSSTSGAADGSDSESSGSAAQSGDTGTESGDDTGGGSAATDEGSSDSGSGATSDSGTSGSSGSGATSDQGSASTSSTGLADGSYTGSSVSTRFGPVQVQITVSGGRITAAQAVDYPSENHRDQQINQYAIPQLVSETISAQSANIDMISGATYTSDGYIRSLQSAIDQATS